MTTLTTVTTWLSRIIPGETMIYSPREMQDAANSQAPLAKVKGVSNTINMPKTNSILTAVRHFPSHLQHVIRAVSNLFGSRRDSGVALIDCNNVQSKSYKATINNTPPTEYIVLNPHSTDRLI